VFSRRLPVDLGPNRLSARAGCVRVAYDLTETNPTRCALPYPESLLESLSGPDALVYRPHPLGPERARRAVATTYARWDADVDPRHVMLTASTSEAYSCLFKLLADPGDAVLVPAPSYPLFEQLARLDGVRATPYRLDPESGWRIDPASVHEAPGNTRAAVVVHPNNPTGTYVHPGDARMLAELCADRGWALIADEVFLPYPLCSAPGSDSTFADTASCLTFSLGGLSKSIGLPQLKLAWVVASGPDLLLADALERLEHVNDAYLSLSTPVAAAAPDLLRIGGAIRDSISTRCRANLRALRTLVAAVPPVSMPKPAGGWSAVLRVPTVIDEESLVLRLLDEREVAVFPGFFFDFPTEGYLVLSLLPPEQVFAEGLRRVLDGVEATLASEPEG